VVVAHNSCREKEAPASAMAAAPPAPPASKSSSSKSGSKDVGKVKGKHQNKVAVQNEEFEANPLADEDGCVGQLFHYLWRRNSLGQTCPGINIPDTVRAAKI
jgi:hypothetical protein